MKENKKNEPQFFLDNLMWPGEPKLSLQFMSESTCFIVSQIPACDISTLPMYNYMHCLPKAINIPDDKLIISHYVLDLHQFISAGYTVNAYY